MDIARSVGIEVPEREEMEYLSPSLSKSGRISIRELFGDVDSMHMPGTSDERIRWHQMIAGLKPQIVSLAYIYIYIYECSHIYENHVLCARRARATCA